MKLVVGLGNPGPKYHLNRHNIGFLCLDFWLESLGVASSRWKSDSQAEHVSFEFEGQKVVLLKPQTYMNLSGQAVQSTLAFYKIPLQNLVVIHDEIDQPFGAIKIHKNRGHAGHNGIRSISQLLGSNDYARLRLGVGRPANPEMSVADYVLQNFSKSEMDSLPAFLERSCDALEAILQSGVDKAASNFNSKVET